MEGPGILWLLVALQAVALRRAGFKESATLPLAASAMLALAVMGSLVALLLLALWFLDRVIVAMPGW